MRIAHVSDPHFGRIVSAHVKDDLIDSIRMHDCDAVLVTGDLTQRARRSEFRAASEFLHALPEPRLVIPGNHDVHAWWHHPDLRIFDPLRRYKKWISHELETEIITAGLAVLGLNTAHGLTVKGGRCTSTQIERVQSFFERQPADSFKILAVHHPLSSLTISGLLDTARNGEHLLTVAAEVGVHVVCAGHWHLAHTEVLEIGGARLLISLAGTATSDRWRSPQIGINSWSLIEKNSQGIDVKVYTYEPNARVFKLSDLLPLNR